MRDRGPLGTDPYDFKPNGLFKTSLHIRHEGGDYHIIAYYSLNDILLGDRKRPCFDQTLYLIEPREEIMKRAPTIVEEHKDSSIEPTSQLTSLQYLPMCDPRYSYTERYVMMVQQGLLSTTASARWSNFLHNVCDSEEMER